MGEKSIGIIVLGVVAVAGLAVVAYAMVKPGQGQTASLAITAAGNIASMAVGGISGFITGMSIKSRKKPTPVSP